MTIPPITGDQRFVKAINRNVLLRLLLDEPAQSRAALAERSGLTKSTVSLLTKELLEEGWLAEDDVAVTGSLGRRPTPLRIAGRGLALIGAELGTDRIRVVTTSLHGDVLESTSVPLEDRTPDVACHQLVKLVTRQSAHVAQTGARLLGVGVGLPGAIDTAHGIIEFAPNLGWHNVEVGQRLSRELAAAALGQVPVYCQNEADLAAIGEVLFGSRPADDPLVYVSCSVGVGSGIVLNGALFTGATGSAGEIGHTILHIDGLPCSCGRRGCAEAYVGLKAVARAAGFLRGDDVDREGLSADLANPRARKARKAFVAAGDALGVLLQNAWTTFNPKAIVLGGEAVTLGGQHFLDAAIARLTQYSHDAGVPPPAVRVARYGDLATAAGGAAFALHALLRPYGHDNGALKINPA
ncbi:MAG: ROK family transcriptional regulator [Burkholderiaceae bacterium]|jgi:predicted NBD/HSP70 family sugar kinase